MKLKTLLVISALCVPSFLIFSPEKAHALPFNENCASMQAYANTIKFSNPVRFSGFEDKQMVNYGYIMCTGGYAKETSPMGTRVCVAQLQYNQSALLDAYLGMKGISWTPLNTSNSCRWM